MNSGQSSKEPKQTSFKVNPETSEAIKFLSACRQIGLLEEDKQSWENFKKSKAKVDENFINQKIKDRNNARKKGNYKLADILRKELEDNGVIIEDKQEKTVWKYK